MSAYVIFSLVRGYWKITNTIQLVCSIRSKKCSFVHYRGLSYRSITLECSSVQLWTLENKSSRFLCSAVQKSLGVDGNHMCSWSLFSCSYPRTFRCSDCQGVRDIVPKCSFSVLNVHSLSRILNVINISEEQNVHSLSRTLNITNISECYNIHSLSRVLNVIDTPECYNVHSLSRTLNVINIPEDYNVQSFKNVE